MRGRFFSGPLGRGFTVIELLIALTLALIVGGIILSSLARQQRFYRGVGDMMDVREHVRDASDVLTADLWATSVVGDTIRLAVDTAIELSTSIGTSTLCARPSGPTLSLPPDTLASGNELTAWLTTPDTGDDVLVFHDSSAMVPVQGWERFHVVNIGMGPLASVCALSSGLTTAADVVAGRRGYEIAVTPPPSPSIRAGAPVRFVRRGRYSVYRASDQQWYLGYRRCSTVTGQCSVVQPVSGPYHGHAVPPISFHYYGSDGRELTPEGQTVDVARVEIVARDESLETLQIPGFPHTQFVDSAVGSVTFRNGP